MRFWVH